jgi:hypothetical protein
MLLARVRARKCDESLKSTPLGWACRWGRVALVELLLARGEKRAFDVTTSSFRI